MAWDFGDLVEEIEEFGLTYQDSHTSVILTKRFC